MTSCRALTGAPPRPTGAAVHVHVHVHNRSSCNCEVGLGQSDLTTDREDPAAAPASPARHRTQCTGKPWGAHTPGHVIGWEHHATDVGADQADDARQAPLGRRKARNQGTDSLLSNQRSPRSHVHACQRRYRKGLPSGTPAGLAWRPRGRDPTPGDWNAAISVWTRKRIKNSITPKRSNFLHCDSYPNRACTWNYGSGPMVRPSCKNLLEAKFSL